MGAWGTGTFDNDTACDWSYGLEAVNDLTLVISALVEVQDIGEELLDADFATEGLAAAEVVARLKGRFGIRDPYTEPVDAWVQAHPMEVAPHLVELTTWVIDRIVAPPSELLELWRESSYFADWQKEMKELRNRVTS